MKVEPELRKQKNLEQVENLACEAGGSLLGRMELMNLVNYLVEYPVPEDVYGKSIAKEWLQKSCEKFGEVFIFKSLLGRGSTTPLQICDI